MTYREPEKMPVWFALPMTLAGIVFAILFMWEFCTREPLRDKLKREHVEFIRRWSVSEEGQAIMERYAEYNRLIGSIRNLRADHVFIHELPTVIETPPTVQLWHPDAAKFYSPERVSILRNIYEMEVDKP